MEWNINIPPPKVAFLSSIASREMLPLKIPPSRLGSEIGLRGTPDAGPGCYQVEEKTSLAYQLGAHPETNKGYVLGARTAPKFEKTPKVPSPYHYQRRDGKNKMRESAKKPFNVGSERFSGRVKVMLEMTPGPGSYDHVITRGRKVCWPQSFGGSPVHLPAISLKSTIFRNTNKLSTTKEEQKFRRKLAYLQLYFD